MPYCKVVGEGNYVHELESPTGSRIEVGEVFACGSNWLKKREGCPFLKPASAQEYEAQQPSSADEPGSYALDEGDKADGESLDKLSRGDAWALIKERGLDDKIAYKESSAEDMIALLKEEVDA